MAVQPGGRAPYASTSSVLNVIERHRQVGLKAMDLQKLQNIGVTEALAPRTLQTVTLLDFYDETGQVTPEFDALRKVGDQDFKVRLGELLSKAYAPILEILDPASATTQDVENAFRGFEPTGQLGRMVQLFMGLMIYAGLMPEDQRRRPPASGGRTRKSAAGKGSKGSGDAADKGGTGRQPEHETPPKLPDPEPQTSGHKTRADLGEAGYVELVVHVNPLKLSRDDRTFLFDLVDKVEARRQSVPPNPPAS